MDKRTEEISKIILSLDAAKFISCVDRYVKTAMIPGYPESPKGKNRKNEDQGYAAAQKEADEILLQSDLSLKHLLDFRFKMNGHSESGEKTQAYFRQMRNQQMEILMQISEETEIILNMIRYSEKMFDIIRSHSNLLQESEFLMDAVGGRISRESSLSVRPEYRSHNDADVRKLAGTFQCVKDYEDAYSGNITENPDKDASDIGTAVCQELLRDTRKSIDAKKKKLGEDIRELRQGWKILSILATTGYSRRIRRSLKSLVKAHNTRVAEFQEYIRQCRSGFSGFRD